jgi:biotin operon repressor
MFGKRWTPEEIELLEEKWGSTSTETILKEINRKFHNKRTKHSIQNKVSRLNLGGGLENGEYLTANKISEMLGETRRKIRYFINQKGLKCRKMSVHSNRKYYMIKYTDLIKWMKVNLDSWNAAKCDIESFIAKDKKWMKEKLKSDKKKPLRKFWTEYENQRAFMLWGKGVSTKEIAEELGRTDRAVKEQLLRIKRELLGKPDKRKVG